MLQTIDDYELLEKCGEGGFGIVYRAKGPVSNVVALKKVSTCGSNYKREIEALKEYQQCSDNDGIIKILHVSSIRDEYFYYTMELADNLTSDGEQYIPWTLAEYLKIKKQPLKAVDTLEMIRQLLDGLESVHNKGFVHRDIKPGNILWVNGKAKLGDIGLLANDGSMTMPAGSAGFIPPESSGIKLNTPEADVYALCRVVYCAVSGKTVSNYPRIEFTDDLKQNGKALIKIINCGMKKCTIKDIRAILDKYAPLQNTGDVEKKEDHIAMKILKIGGLACLSIGVFIGGIIIGRNSK